MHYLLPVLIQKIPEHIFFYTVIDCLPDRIFQVSTDLTIFPHPIHKIHIFAQCPAFGQQLGVLAFVDIINMTDKFYLRMLRFLLKRIRKPQIILLRSLLFAIIKHDKMRNRNLQDFPTVNITLLRLDPFLNNTCKIKQISQRHVWAIG